MTRPLEPFDFLNRGWEIRLFEGHSPCCVFVVLPLDVFMLGNDQLYADLRPIPSAPIRVVPSRGLHSPCTALFERYLPTARFLLFLYILKL
jgi:hypothetical protein